MTTAPHRSRNSYRIGHAVETERAHIHVVFAGRHIPARIVDESAMGLRVELPAGETLPFHQPVNILYLGGLDQVRVVWSNVTAGKLQCGLERVGTESDRHARVLRARNVSSIVGAEKALGRDTPADRFLGLMSAAICLAVLDLVFIGEQQTYKLLSEFSLFLSRTFG